MAIKGNAYTKTVWQFQERPVASSKMNTWDDRIESGLELAHENLEVALGGTDGVVRRGATDSLRPHAAAIPALYVEVYPGTAYIAGLPFALDAVTASPPVVAPVSQDRVDLLEARLEDWSIGIVAGSESATPTAPAASADALPLAELYLRPAMSSIQDTDDSTNGYISDVRAFA
jgi:hypothetical protein